ncbi:MAG TPA: hypothetical protein DCQ94_15275 [Nitrospira sp.]|nr:hypothetical protein [Nitrospira sp.]
MKVRNRFRQRGVTLAEVMVSASISTVVLFSAITIFLSGISAWARGQGRMDAETQSRQAVRVVSDALREAMWVSVDADGMGLTYRLPRVDGDGAFEVPVIWDGIDRRIALTSGKLNLTDAAGTRTICRNIRLTDPESPGGLSTYRIFTPGPGSITRRLAVQVVTETNGARSEKVVGRKRETVFLRNIPELTR